jgi:hypothetical protein
VALAPDIGLLLPGEINNHIDLMASERVHELDGVFHQYTPTLPPSNMLAAALCCF